MTTSRIRRTALAATLTVAFLGALPASAVDTAPTGPDPATFAHPVANPWFPLRPGTVWHLRGTDEGRRYTERVAVTHRHRTITGIRATVVRDVVRRADRTVAERTLDWYAADDTGRVWYLGERTATYDRQGNVEDRDGSWQAGQDGARAGVIMPAHPHVTQAFRQEYRRGEAEDQAWIVQRGARVRTPAISSRRALRSLEWTRLEPRVVSAKLYVRGYGLVAEHDMSGGSERFELVRMHR